jgi:hypothetical protein
MKSLIAFSLVTIVCCGVIEGQTQEEKQSKSFLGLPNAPSAVPNPTPSSPAPPKFVEDSAEAVEPVRTQPSRVELTHRVIRSGIIVPPLTPSEKLKLSIRSATGFTAFGWALFGAGTRHLTDSRPHYGTDKAGFGERLGAASLKQASEEILSYGVYASLFHEDPHYYVLGKICNCGIKDRAIYSATRVFITRTDAGGTSVNWAKMAGVASSNALTLTYYPERDRDMADTLSGIGVSLGISMVSNEMHEFIGDVITKIRHKNTDK